MKTTRINKTLLTLVVSSGFVVSSTSHAAITLIEEWRMGEPGTTNPAVANAFGQYIIADIDTTSGTAMGGAAGHTIRYSQGATSTLITTGLAAPGSTGAYRVNGNANQGVYDAATGFGLTDDWALQLWYNPTSTSGIFLNTNGGTANNVALAISGGNFAIGGSNNGFTSSISSGIAAAIGTWYKIDVIRYNGVNYLGINDSYVSATTATYFSLDKIMLGMGRGGNNGAKGIYDEMKVHTFDHNVDTIGDVQTAMAAIPEPSSALLGGLGALCLLRRRR